MNIYVQDIGRKEFFAGDKFWSDDAAKAYAFPNALSALEFCNAFRAQHPGVQLMILFGSTEILNRADNEIQPSFGLI